MPTTSALSLITRALRVIGEVAGEEVPTAAQAQDGLEHLQDLMDALKTQRLMIPSVLRSVFPLTLGKANYTLGVGGEFNLAQPVTVEWVRLILDPNAPNPLEIPIRILTDEQYARYDDKWSKGQVEMVYFEHNWASGMEWVRCLPVPHTSTAALVVYSPVPFPEFAALQTTYTFPPGWNRVLRLKLAKALAPEYGRGFASEDELAEAWADVKRVNHRPRELRSDYPDCEAVDRRAHGYNILTDH